VYLIIFCVFILYTAIRDGKTFQSNRVSGVIDTRKPLEYYYYVLLTSIDMLRVPTIRLSGQLLYACVFIYDFIMFTLSVRCDQIQ